MLDRLLHRSVVFNIDGDSYRMRAHQARDERHEANSSTPHQSLSNPWLVNLSVRLFSVTVRTN